MSGKFNRTRQATKDTAIKQNHKKNIIEEDISISNPYWNWKKIYRLKFNQDVFERKDNSLSKILQDIDLLINYLLFSN